MQDGKQMNAEDNLEKETAKDFNEKGVSHNLGCSIVILGAI